MYTSDTGPLPLRSIPRAAPGDLILIKKPHPYSPTRDGVFLRNNNASKGIIASIRVDAASSLFVETPSRLTKKRRWPLHFEIRLPPGSEVVIGFAEMLLWTSIISQPPSPPNAITDIVLQQYVIEGAYYHDLPLPPPQDDPNDSLWVFSVPIINDPFYHWGDFLINLHPSRALEGIVRPRPSMNGPLGISVAPGSWTQVAAEPQQQQFSILSLKFT